MFFIPAGVQLADRVIYSEVKGYGQDGHDMSLWLHDDGDIHSGMFYKNAKKEYDALAKATEAGLRVPLPLLCGKIPRNVWFESGIRMVAEMIHRDDVGKIQLPTSYDDVTAVETCLRQVLRRVPRGENPFNAFKQPYSAGFVVRGPRSPFRVGSPTEKYEKTDSLCWIAKTCGETFYRLIDLGYLHLCPGTGNWTTEAELTDMSDCYDLQRDKNIEAIIKIREEKFEGDFWQTLIGPTHTANLTPFFIGGMLGKNTSVKEAASELEHKVRAKVAQLKVQHLQ